MLVLGYGSGAILMVHGVFGISDAVGAGYVFHIHGVPPAYLRCPVLLKKEFYTQF
jgi:hypothetical protein